MLRSPRDTEWYTTGHTIKKRALRAVLQRRGLFHRLNSAIGACRYAYAVAVAFCLVDDGFSVHQRYCFLRTGFDALQRALAFCRIDDYFHGVILS